MVIEKKTTIDSTTYAGTEYIQHTCRTKITGLKNSKT